MKPIQSLRKPIRLLESRLDSLTTHSVDRARRNFLAWAGGSVIAALAAGADLNPAHPASADRSNPIRNDLDSTVKYRILSLGGGGVRALVVSGLLERLAEGAPHFLESVDLFVGSSTGGILALMLAKGSPPQEFRHVFERYAAEFYRPAGAQEILEYLFGSGDILQRRRTSGALYSNSSLISRLREIFGDLTLGDLYKRVLVPAFDLGDKSQHRTWVPRFFHNFPGPDSDVHERLVDVAARCSATPGYFPAYHGYIDAGHFSINPSMSALALALDQKRGERTLADVSLLSIGSGFSPQYIADDAVDWSPEQWARPLTDIIFSASQGIANFQCQRLLGEERYLHFDVLLPTPVPLDAVNRIPELLVAAAGVDIRKAAAFVDTYFTISPGL